ncbi:porin [Betaproteobacteria bacterium]|nr:porin [Betaproteobacteria bacterium]
MQKKLIALAVAGLVSAPAFAQSNVTIYGSVDFGYTFQNRNIASGVDSRSAVDSGISKSNRLGFQGTEDLGNGLKAVFVLETGLAGERSDQTGLWGGAGNRQSYLGLAGGFGTVALGRQYTPQHLFTAAVDPFGKNGLGDASHVLAQDARLDNLLAYISPTWSGFSFVAGFTNSYSGDEGLENKSGIGVLGTSPLKDARVWAFAPSYSSGPIFAALNIHQARTNESDPLKSIGVIEGYFSYDLKVVKISALAGQRKTKLDGGNDLTIKQALLGVSAPVGPNGKILSSYTYRKVDTDRNFLAGVATGYGDGAKLGQFSLGYEHSLSKRTTLYAQYAHQTQNRQQKGLLGASALSGAVGAIGATSSGVWGNGDGYRQGFAVGARHNF